MTLGSSLYDDKGKMSFPFRTGFYYNLNRFDPELGLTEGPGADGGFGYGEELVRRRTSKRTFKN